jgi:putative transcriptional regulator
MTNLGKRLVRAAREANAIAKGELDPSTYRVHVPQVIDVQAVRKRLHMSQGEFAARFGIPIGTIRDWEQHRRHPDGATRVLLTVIDKEPEAVERALRAV